MGKTIHIDILNLDSIRKGIKDIEEYKKWLDRKCDELAKRLAEYGLTMASVAYEDVLYDGDRDVNVTVEHLGQGKYAVVASGFTVLFLEFGAGITYGKGHPQDAEFGYGPGTYPGQKHAFDPNGWWFVNAAGEKVHTYGNAPSMAMYLTAKELRDKAEEIAREVFSE